MGAEPEQLVAAEYFWDTDPGEGAATPVLVSATDFYQVDTNSASRFSSAVSNLAPGIHLLGFRLQNAGGEWSESLKVAVEVQDANLIVAAVEKWPQSDANEMVVGGEYFWDSDPGLGMGTNVTVSPGLFLRLSSTSSPPFSANLSALGPGFHHLNFRARNARGDWSDPLQVSLEILDPAPIISAVTEWPSSDDGKLIVGGEYFWESDVSNATSFTYSGRNVLIPGWDGVPYLSFDVSQLQPGAHYFGYRVRDGSGRWSATFSAGFTIEWSNAWAIANADQLPLGTGASMGAAWGDYTRDGFPDLFIGNQSAAYNLLYRNNGDGSFSSISATQAVASVLGGAGGRVGRL